MGSVKENLLTKGFSGRIGDEIVFRQVGNRTLFAKRPRKRTNLVQSAQATRFSKAVLYAKTVLLDDAIRAEYEEAAALAGFNSAYVAAVTDYLKDPIIALVYTDLYKGAAGDLIWITALDDFKIQSVTVTLQQPNGTLIEAGQAVAESSRWKYITTQPNATVAGTKVIVTAKDRPGQEVVAEKVLA
ncbi:MAG: hypothetical protein ACKVOQ_06295 [Cyclobacteriaceae bacterium]